MFFIPAFTYIFLSKNNQKRKGENCVNVVFENKIISKFISRGHVAYENPLVIFYHLI